MAYPADRERLDLVKDLLDELEAALELGPFDQAPRYLSGLSLCSKRNVDLPRLSANLFLQDREVADER